MNPNQQAFKNLFLALFVHVLIKGTVDSPLACGNKLSVVSAAESCTFNQNQTPDSIVQKTKVDFEIQKAESPSLPP